MADQCSKEEYGIVWRCLNKNIEKLPIEKYCTNEAKTIEIRRIVAQAQEDRCRVLIRKDALKPSQPTKIPENVDPVTVPLSPITIDFMERIIIGQVPTIRKCLTGTGRSNYFNKPGGDDYSSSDDEMDYDNDCITID